MIDLSKKFLILEDISIKAKEYEQIKIIRYESSLYYANVENFSYKIVKLSGVNPSEVIQQISKIKSTYENKIKAGKANMVSIEIDHICKYISCLIFF